MHLTIRVAWHDNQWDGTICRAPSRNSFCIALDRIRETPRDDDKEDRLAGLSWADLSADDLPPCIAEAGGFMTPHEWVRLAKHPYQTLKATRKTHGHLAPTPFTAPPYSTFAVPFWWMLRKNQDQIDQMLPDPLPPDLDPPFDSPWVFGHARQEALSRIFFDRLQEGRSLVFFYTKEGHPLGDDIIRLVVGVGTTVKVGPLLHFESSDPQRPTYPTWDRNVRHSIRPDGAEGFLLPYHVYLEPTGDPAEDERRVELLRDIAIVPPADHLRAFSYMTELVSPDIALSTLTLCLGNVRRIKAHGIAKGPWDAREDWLNEQIAAVWQERGAFPGLGSVLEAIGLRLGTALALDLFADGIVGLRDDPWPTVDAILRNQEPSPRTAYEGDLDAVRSTWAGLSDERRGLLRLLSRFDLTPNQAIRWFNPEKRPVRLSDAEIMANLYRIPEVDLGDETDGPIGIGVMDRGLLPDSTIAARHPIPSPSTVSSRLDARRVRASIVTVLRGAAENGDALLAELEVLERMERLALPQACAVTNDWLQANQAELTGMVERLEVSMNDPTTDEPDHQISIAALQLTDLAGREERLRKVLSARARKPLPSTHVDWKSLVVEAIEARGGRFDPANARHAEALEEQAAALETITTRRLSVLVGRAGTGKTSALGALLRCEAIANDGILMLAPTGKARVLLGRAAGSEAMTVAQFLHRLGRYDGLRQRPLFSGEEMYRKEKTIVIDESSMLTMDDLYAVLQALDQVHVQRIILVGDPNQLPPIGVGRPFADLVGSMELAARSDDPAQRALSQAMGKLTVEVRSAATGPSDTLYLASWFTREQQPADADRIFSDLEADHLFNDLEIRFWKSPEDLRELLFDTFCHHLGLRDPKDVQGFDKALGLTEQRWVPFEDPDGAENFQILSPVRMHPYGIYALNRLVQKQFRGPELYAARRGWKARLGDEEIVIRDKVIQIENQRRSVSDTRTRQSEQAHLANGEVGICATDKKGYLNVVFAGRPYYTVGYHKKRDFGTGSGPLELAYALTVHKAQGSEFGKVFVILPKHCRLLSRELLYTALTRSREQLVLLIEGSDASALYEYTRPESSEVSRRNTNLFMASVRSGADEVPFAEHLIHRTLKGHMVRSKSELVIANLIFQMGIDYQYEPPFEGLAEPGIRRPDFLFADPAGDPIVWEHLGMLSRDDYRRSWEKKRAWYLQNGLMEGISLFTTQDDERGGLDSDEVRRIAEQIMEFL